MSPSLLLGGGARGTNGAPTGTRTKGSLLPARLPSPLCKSPGCPTVGPRRGVVAQSFPRPECWALAGGGPCRLLLRPAPARMAGKDSASPLQGQRSQVNQAGSKMMELLHRYLTGDAGWVSCGARILAFLQSGPASGR